jgi:photosystem II stability/assembly factor-like uncharacterized protein
MENWRTNLRGLLCLIAILQVIITSTQTIFAQAGQNSFMMRLNSTPTSSEQIQNSYEERQELKTHSQFNGLHWEQAGPFDISGRISDIAVNPDRNYEFYAASASGGVFKTINNGTTWECIFDSAPTLSIGDIAISESNTNLIFVGTGESNIARSTINGSGVYKTTDGGKNWMYSGLGNTQHISRIIIDPQNNDVVFVAAMGTLFTRNSERGVFKTTDGGKNWKKVLYINDYTSITDLVINPLNNQELFAAVTEKDRRPWHLVKGGSGSGIYKTNDGGTTWIRLVEGLPQNDLIGRIGLDICNKNPQIVYALVDNQNPKNNEDKNINQANVLTFSKVIGAEIYRSDNGGKSWQKTHQHYLPEDVYFSYGYNFGQIRINPTNPEEIYILGVHLFKSIDGGKTIFRSSSDAVHADHHAMWINPANPNQIILGNDGGVYQSYDGSKSWKHCEPLPISQYYSITHDYEDPYNIYGGFQDYGDYKLSSKDRIENYSPSEKLLFLGDGAVVACDPNNPDIVYGGQNFGLMYRFNLRSDTRKYITPEPAPNEEPYRFFWISPFLISKYNSSILYYAANKVFRSKNQGDTWDVISKDLTTNPKPQGNFPYATITALDESPLQSGLLYAGTDDGLLWVTKDDGKTWEKLTNGLPADRLVSSICTSAASPGKLYISYNGDKNNDYTTYLFESDNYGKTFKSVVNNLPKYEPVNVIRESPFDSKIVYVGTNGGVYVSLDSGENWNSLHANLPEVPVFDLKIHPQKGDVIIGTHGRSAFILENGIKNDLFQKEVLIKLPQIVKIRTDLATDNTYLIDNPIIYVKWNKEHPVVKIELFDINEKCIYSKRETCIPGINQFDLNLNELLNYQVQPGKYRISVTHSDNCYSEILNIESTGK